MAIKPKNTQKSTGGDKKAPLVVDSASTKKNTRTKYDWDKIKAEFFASDFLDVFPFIQHKYGTDTAQGWQAKSKTVGWAEEKRKIQDEMKLEALKQFKSNIRKQWDAVFEKMEMAHVQGLEDLANMILDQGKVVKRKKISEMKDPETWEVLWSQVLDIDWLNPYLNHWDLTSIIKHIKLEKWEPTDIMDTNGKSLARAWLDDLKKQKGDKPDPKKPSKESDGV